MILCRSLCSSSVITYLCDCSLRNCKIVRIFAEINASYPLILLRRRARTFTRSSIIKPSWASINFCVERLIKLARVIELIVEVHTRESIGAAIARDRSGRFPSVLPSFPSPCNRGNARDSYYSASTRRQ